MNMMKKLITFTILIASSRLFAMELKGLQDVFTATNSQKATPQLKVMQGNPPVPIEFKVTKPTIVHFWATWCAPCVDELPKLAASASQFKKSGIDVVFISIDVGASTKVPLFLTKLKITDLPVFWDSRSDLYKKFSLQMLPTSIFISDKGKEIGRATGAVSWNADADLKFIKSKI